MRSGDILFLQSN